MDCPLLDLGAIAYGQLPRDPGFVALQQRFQILVLARRSNRLLVASAEPGNEEVENTIMQATKLAVEWVVVEFDKLPQANNTLETVASSVIAAQAAAPSGDELNPASFDFESVAEDDNQQIEDGRQAEIDNAPVVRFFQTMLDQALQLDRRLPIERKAEA